MLVGAFPVLREEGGHPESVPRAHLKTSGVVALDYLVEHWHSEEEGGQPFLVHSGIFVLHPQVHWGEGAVRTFVLRWEVVVVLVGVMGNYPLKMTEEEVVQMKKQEGGQSVEIQMEGPDMVEGEVGHNPQNLDLDLKEQHIVQDQEVEPSLRKWVELGGKVVAGPLVAPVTAHPSERKKFQYQHVILCRLPNKRHTYSTMYSLV